MKRGLLVQLRVELSTPKLRIDHVKGLAVATVALGETEDPFRQSDDVVVVAELRRKRVVQVAKEGIGASSFRELYWASSQLLARVIALDLTTHGQRQPLKGEAAGPGRDLLLDDTEEGIEKSTNPLMPIKHAELARTSEEEQVGADRLLCQLPIEGANHLKLLELRRSTKTVELVPRHRVLSATERDEQRPKIAFFDLTLVHEDAPRWSSVIIASSRRSNYSPRATPRKSPFQG